MLSLKDKRKKHMSSFNDFSMPTNSAKKVDELVNRRGASHLKSFKNEVLAEFSQCIRAVILFGSRARGDAKVGSDYDVAVIVDGPYKRRNLDHKLADLAYRHIIEGVHIRPVSVPVSLLTDSNSALAEELARDGVWIQ